MAKKKTIQSIEPNIADLANGWLKSYKLEYKLEQENLNSEIDKALNDYYSKNGGAGGNRPDAKLLLKDKNGSGDIQHEIGVYYVSKLNLGAGQKIDEYSDFSFLPFTL